MPDDEWAHGFVRYARAITEALRLGSRSLPGAATFEEGWRNQLVLDAIRRSNAERRWVQLAANP
jgi:predicted dehydrogenase